MKSCSNCKLPKAPEEFPRNTKAKDGRGSWCRECCRLLEEVRRRAAGITAKVIPLDCGNDHKECLKCRDVLALDKFPDNKRGAKGKGSYCKLCINESPKTPEKREQQRQGTQDYRDRDRDWWRFLHRCNMQKRRALKRDQDSGLVTTAILKALYTLTCCSYCGRETDKADRTIDHVIPLAGGGLHHPDNLVMACGRCNSRKKDRDVDDFRAELRRETRQFQLLPPCT